MMLSRLVRPSKSVLGQFTLVQGSQLPPNTICIARCLSSGTKAALAPYKEGPERDLVNFPRPKRAMYSPPVKFGFLPENWFAFFYPKTGYTGGYVFGAGLLTYILSKEIWVLEHEFWGGVSFFIMIIYAVKKFGPQANAWMEKEQQKQIEDMNAGKVAELKALNESIQLEKKAQFQAEGMKTLFDVKRENVGLQLEAVYRERLMEVYREVKRRLDYQVEKVNVERNIQQRHMVNWIVDSVKKSITAESEQETLKKCIADLKGLSAKA